MVGIRYWIDQMIGIDAGLGLLVTSGSFEQDYRAARYGR